MHGTIPQPMPTTLRYLACLEGNTIFSSFSRLCIFIYSLLTRSLESAPFLELTTLLLRLGSWHVQRSCFHRLLAEVRCCITVRIHYKKSEYNAGVNITEVAHDIQAQVSKYVRETLGLVNFHDTWHGTVTCVCVAMLVPTTCILYTHNNSFGTGTKNVAKEMKKITEGRVKERGKKWFPDLADKSKDVCSSVLST